MSMLAPRIPHCLPADFKPFNTLNRIFVQDEVVLLFAVLSTNKNGKLQWSFSSNREVLTVIANGTSKIVHRFLEEGIHNVSVHFIGSVHKLQADFSLVAVREIRISNFKKAFNTLVGALTRLPLSIIVANNEKWSVNFKCEDFQKRKAIIPSHFNNTCEVININMPLKFHSPGFQQCLISFENNMFSIQREVAWNVYSSNVKIVIETKPFVKLGERVSFRVRFIPEFSLSETKVLWKVINQETDEVVLQGKLIANKTLSYNFNQTGCFEVRIVVFNVYANLENNTVTCVQSDVKISSITPSSPIIYIKTKHPLRFAVSFEDNSMVRCLWTFRCHKITLLRREITFDVEKCKFYRNFSTAAFCIVSLTVHNDVSRDHFWDFLKIYIENPVLSITASIPGLTKVDSIVQLDLSTIPFNKETVVKLEVNFNTIKPELDAKTLVYKTQIALNTPGINKVKFIAYNNVSHIVVRHEILVLPELESISIEHFGCPSVGYFMRFQVRVNGKDPENNDRMLFLWKVQMNNTTSLHHTSTPIFQTNVFNSTGTLRVFVFINNEVDAKFANTSVNISDGLSTPCFHHNAVSELGKATNFYILGLPDENHCRVVFKLEITQRNLTFRIFPYKVRSSGRDEAIQRWRYNFQSSGFHSIMGLVFLECSDSSRNLAFRSGIHVQERLTSVRLTGQKFLYLKRFPHQNKWIADVKPNALGNVFVWKVQNEEKVTAVSEIYLSDAILPGKYELQVEVLNGLGHLEDSMTFEATVALLLLNYTLTDFFISENGIIALHINQVKPLPKIFIDFGNNVTCHLDYKECGFEFETVESALIVKISHMYTSSGVYDIYFNASNPYGSFEQSDIIVVEEHINNVDLILLSPTVVSLFEKVVVMCSVKSGSNLNFEWDFGEYMDDQYTTVHSFARNSTAYHSYGIADTYNISVTVYNNYEEISVYLNQSIQAVEEIKDLHLQPLSGFYAVPLHVLKSDSEVGNGGLYATDPIKFKASVWRGSDVQFLFDFGDGTTELVPSQPPLWDFSYAVVKHTYFSEGVYEVYVTATNLLDSVKTKLDLPLYVQLAPEGLKLDKLYYIVEHGNNLTLHASLTYGTNVSFNWNVGNEYFTNFGNTLFLQSINPGIYEANVEAYNEVTDFSSKSLNRPIFSSKIYVQEKLQAIDVCLIINETEICGNLMLELPLDEIVLLKAKTTPSTESHLRFIWQLGIGELKRTNNPFLRHQYQHAGWYHINITAQNHISTVSSDVLHLHLVQKIANLTSIHSQGPNLVNYPVTYNVFYWFGTNLTFQWDFGDGSLPITTNTSSVSHTYKEVGEYWISVNVWNKFSHADISANMFFLHQICHKPKITFLHLRNRIARYDDDILIEADIAILCQQINAYYSWNIESLESTASSASLNDLSTLHQRQLIIPAYFLPVGAYRIHLKVEMIGTIVYAASTAILDVEMPSPYFSIYGGFVRWMGYNDTIKVKADINRSTSLSYQWSCSPRHQARSNCFDSNVPPAFVSNNFSQFALSGSYFAPGLSAVVINVTADHKKLISASQVIEIKQVPNILMLNIDCSDCHKFGVNQDITVRLKASCSNCEDSTVEYNWKIWVIEDIGYRMHFSNYKCVQADGSTFFIMAPNSTSDSPSRNISLVQNEESLSFDRISKGNGINEDYPPFPNLPEFPEDPKLFQRVKESSVNDGEFRSRRNSQTFEDFDVMDFLPFQDIPIEGRAHYDDNITWNIDPEFLPNPIPDLLNPDYLITEEGVPGEGGSAAARHQSSHGFGLDENIIYEGAGMPRIKSSDDYNVIENDPFFFGDPVRDNTVDHKKLPPPHLVNRPRTLLSLSRADTTTGFNSDTLILKPGIFKVGSSYLAQVTAINKDNNLEGFAMEYFKVHVGPINGRCTLMPLKGHSLNFDFRLHCLEWKADYSPLYYELRYSFEKEEAGHLVYFGLNENIRFTLPAGYKHNSYHVFLSVIVRDSVGAPTKVCSLSREVKPVSLNSTILQYVYNETFHPRSILRKLLGEKHNQAVLHQIHVLASSLNNMEEDNFGQALHPTDQQLQKGIIHSLLDCINDLKIATKVEATEMLSALSEIISSRQNINLFELQRAYNIYEKLRRRNETLYNFFAIESYQHGLLTFLSRLALAANSKPVNNAELINLARKHLLEEVTTLMKSRLKIEEPLSVRLPHSYISAGYISEENKSSPKYLKLNQVRIPLVKKTDLFPGSEANHYNSCVDETCKYDGSCAIFILHELDYITLLPRSYMQLFSSKEISVLITLLSCDKLEDITMDMKKHLNFTAHFVRVQDTKVKNSSTLTKEYMNVHQINISDDETHYPLVFHLNLNTSDLLNSVDVLFRYESLPTLQEYDLKKSFSANSNDTSVFIPPDKVETPGTYFFGILSTPFEFDETYKEVICEYNAYVWKDVCLGKSSASWSAKHCVVLESSNYNWTHCSCSAPEITAYSVPLEWDLTFIPTSELLETGFNYFPILAYVILFIIYCLYFFFNLQGKGNIRLPHIPVSLKDNCNENKHLYLIYISTGMFPSSGTTASVFIVLHGMQSVTETRQLIGSDCESISFQKGSIDTFLLSTQDNLGPLMKVEVWHNNHGMSPSWYLNTIVIKDVNTGTYYDFNCYNWLSVDKGDGQIEREITVIENVLTYKQLLYRNFITFIYDFNMWNVLYFESPISFFTATQRLTCCLCSCINIAFLLCILQEDVFGEHLEEYSISHVTWRTLIFCLCISTVVAIPQLIYSMLFRFSIPPPVNLDPNCSIIFSSLSMDNLNCWLKNKLTTSSSRSDRSSMEDSNSMYSSEHSSSISSVPNAFEESFSSVEKDALEFSIAFSDISEPVSPLQNISSTWQACENWLRKKHNLISNYELNLSNRQLSSIEKQSDNILLEEFSVGGSNYQIDQVIENLDEMSATSGSYLTIGTKVKDNGMPFDTISLDEKLNRRFLFPTFSSFFYYAAWLTVICNVSGSAFLSLQYITKFSYSFCIYWLQCIFITVLCSCLIVTPVLIILIVFIYSLQCPHFKIQHPCTAEDAKTKDKNCDFGSQPSFTRMEYFKKYLRPPKEQILEQFRKYSLKERITLSFHREIWQFLFMFVLLMSLMLPEDTNERYHHRRAIQNAFSKPKNLFFKNVHHSKEEVWSWLEKDFLNGFYGSVDCLNYNQECGIEFSTGSRLVGASILKYYNESSQCDTLFPIPSEESKQFHNESSRNQSFATFEKFYEHKFTNINNVEFFISNSFNLSSIKFEGMDQIYNLINWLDLPSVAASVEFMLFNPVFSLLTSVSFLFQVNPQGTITVHLYVSSVKINDVTSVSYHLNFIVFLIYITVIAFSCKNHLWKIFKDKFKYQTDLWNFHALTFLSTSIVYAILCICYLLEFKQIANKLKVTQLESNIDIRRLVYFETAIRSFNAVLLFLHLIRLFKIFYFSSRLQRILKKLSSSRGEICVLFFTLLTFTFIFSIVSKQCAFMETVSSHPLLTSLKSIDSFFPDYRKSEVVHSENIIRRSLSFFITLFMIVIHLYLFSFIRSVLIIHRGSKMHSCEKFSLKDSAQIIRKKFLQYFQTHTPQTVDESDFELPVDFLLIKLEKIADILVAKADVLFSNKDENDVSDNLIMEIFEDCTIPSVGMSEMPSKSEEDDIKVQTVTLQEKYCDVEKMPNRLIATMPRQNKPKQYPYLPTSFHSSLNSERRFKNCSGTIDVSMLSQHKIRKTYPLFHIDSDSSSQTSSGLKKDSSNNCSIRKTKSRGKGKSDALDVLDDA